MSDPFDPYHVWLGIPPEEQPPTHYRLLGLRPFEADGDVIGNALDQRLAHLRTLQAGKRAALSQKLLNEVSAAGVALLDPKRKSEYDQQLRAQQPPETTVHKMASPPPRKATLLKARSLEADALAAAVVPLPDEGYALQPTPAPAATISPAQPLSNMAWSSPAAASPASPAYGRRSGSGAGIALAIAAACVVVLTITAGGVAWLLRSPPTLQPGPPIAGPQDPQDSPTPPIAVTPPPGPPVTPGDQSDTTPVVPPVGSTPVIPDDGRQVWVYADNSRGGLRRMGPDRWVELGEKDATWYRQLEATPEAIHLEQLGGSPTQVRLFSDRLERHHAELYGTTVFYGKWRSFEGLPPFARREPGPERKLQPPNRVMYRHGLVFDGQAQIELPVPEELRQPGQPFTLEMSIRWTDPQAQSHLLECGDVRLDAAQSASGRPMDGLSLSGGGKTLKVAGLQLPLGAFHHLAIVSDGRDGYLVINGTADPRAHLPGLGSLGTGPLRIGFDAKRQAGFRGVLRGLRVSNVNRYPQGTPPVLPKLLAADDQTLLAIDFAVQKDDEIRLVGSVGGTAKRNAAQWVHLGYEGEYVAEMTPSRIDLMKTMIASKQTVVGEIYRTHSEVQLRSPSGRNVLLVPHLPPPSYRYETNVTRTGGDGGLAIGLVLDGQPAMLLIDAAAGGSRATGLLTTGDRVLPGRMQSTDVRLLTSGNSRRLACDVITQDGSALVQLRLDNQLVYEWYGTMASAPLPSEWALPARVMFVGSRDATFTLNTMTLTTRPSPPSGWLARIGGSTPPGVGNPPNSTSPMPPPAAPALKKQPPDPQTLAAELEKAREIYEDELKRATKPDQKTAVARNILKVGQDTTSDATVRYVLIDLARKVFIQAGEVKEAIATARVLEEEFEIPPDSLAIPTIEALESATLVPEQRAALATAAIELAEELLDAEQFEPASKLALAALASANRQRDAELKKDVLQRKNQLLRVVASSQAVQESLKTLEQMPDDPAANLAVGRFRCLVLEDWELGLVNLAKSGDSPLAKAAALDQEALDKPPSAIAAAEAWLALSKDAKSGDREERQAMERRAKKLLEQAVPKLSGLELVRAEKQLEGLKDVASGPVKRPKAGRRGVQDSPGLVGRVLVRNRDVGILVHYLPDYTISRADFDKIRTAAGINFGESWEIRFAGQLVLPTDGRVQVWHAGGSVSGGVHTLLIDGQAVSQVGDDRTKDETQTRNLRRGAHLIGWALKGGDMGTAAMRITPLDAAGNAVPGSPIMTTREVQAAARQLPTKTEFRFGS